MNAIETAATILIVDDDDATRQALVGLLESEGYRALSAADGSIALAMMARMAGEELPDLVLLDVQMVDMDGHAFRAAQRANAALSSVPVLVMTAEPRAREHATAFDARVLYKPFGAAALFDTIARELQRSESSRKRMPVSGAYPRAHEERIRRRDSA